MSRRIVVPLGLPVSGSDRALAESIVPDACRLAGPRGSIVLVCDISSPLFTGEKEVGDYLSRFAAQLCRPDRQVEMHLLRGCDRAKALDEAAVTYRADMIACATHGKGPLGRLVHGGVVWQALAHSAVPVLIRHGEINFEATAEESRRILVPLDGSQLAESALPLAKELAAEWQAPIFLARAVPRTALPDDVSVAHAYLLETAGRLSGTIDTHVLVGSAADALVKAVDDWEISDVVMASHGRTGVWRVILGSVADELVRRLHCPIIVLPLSAVPASQQNRHLEQATPAGAGGRPSSIPRG